MARPCNVNVSRLTVLAAYVALAACNSHATPEQMFDELAMASPRPPLAGVVVHDGVSAEYRAAAARLAPIVTDEAAQSDRYELLPNHAIVRRVDVAGDTATVEITYGPITRGANLDCGATERRTLNIQGGRWVASDEFTTTVC